MRGINVCEQNKSRRSHMAECVREKLLLYTYAAPLFFLSRLSARATAQTGSPRTKATVNGRAKFETSPRRWDVSCFPVRHICEPIDLYVTLRQITEVR